MPTRGGLGVSVGGAELSPADRIAARLADELGAERFAKYFRHQALFRCEGGRLDVVVPSGFVADLIGSRFGDPLRRVAGNVAGAAEVRFRVDPAAFGDAAAAPDAPAGERPAPRRTGRGVRGGQNGLAGRRYRLEDFIVGESNKLAYSAALRMTEPDCPKAFSPLFIHGPCGLGKTHLLQGIALRYAERNPGAAIRYTTAEAFTNDYITAVRAGKVDAFRKAYRAVDLLCIDDVHFLANKHGTQSELLHTFDAIGLDGARVVLASDEHPRQIAKLSDSLVSRFLSGMVVRLDPPERELRERIVRHLAERRGLVLEESAVAFVASAAGAGGPTPSVRDLEGCLTRIEAVRSLLPEAATGGVGLVLARAALGSTNGGTEAAPGRPRKPVRVARIAEEICRTLAVEPGDLIGRGRHKRVVLARSLTAYLSRTMTTMSFPEIAKAMGRPNHSTVVTAVKRIQAQLDRREPADPDGSLGPDLAGISLAQLVDRIRDDILRGGA